MQSYIRLYYNNENYGPLNAPSSLRDICEGLRINLKSIPALLKLVDDSFDEISENLSRSGSNCNIQSSDTKHNNSQETITELDEVVHEGIYQLLVAHPEIPYEKKIEKKKKVLSKNFGTQTSNFVKEEINELNHNEFIDNSLETPLSIAEMENSIEAMKYVIASIPERYVKYNKVLSKNIDKANFEVERLYKIANDVESHQKSLISAEIRKTLIYFQMMTVLVNAWNSVWIKFGPVSRSYHFSDLRHNEALGRAENFLTRFHLWRRVMEGEKWSLIEREVASERNTCLSFISRRAGYNTPHVHLTRGGTVLHPYIYVPRQSQGSNMPFRQGNSKENFTEGRIRPVSIGTLKCNVKTAPSYAEEEALKKFRRVYVKTLTQTKIHRVREMSRLLEELLAFQGPNLNDENLIIDYKFPTHYVRSQIKKEFRLNYSEKEEKMKNEMNFKNSSHSSVMSVSKECQTESKHRGIRRVTINGSDFNSISTLSSFKSVSIKSNSFSEEDSEMPISSVKKDLLTKQDSDTFSFKSLKSENSLLDDLSPSARLKTRIKVLMEDNNNYLSNNSLAQSLHSSTATLRSEKFGEKIKERYKENFKTEKESEGRFRPGHKYNSKGNWVVATNIDNESYFS
ncbi:hypothetical protein HDU92_001605 [Lobulomyces angularis]|nr:hypothetical protein HDU92_001605 [Lobulomyces angularis]